MLTFLVLYKHQEDVSDINEVRLFQMTFLQVGAQKNSLETAAIHRTDITPFRNETYIGFTFISGFISA